MNQILMMMRFLKAEEVYEWVRDNELPEGVEALGRSCSYFIERQTASTLIFFQTTEGGTGKITRTEVETIPPTVLKRIHARLYTACKTAMTPTAMAILVRGELQKIGITGSLDE